MSFEALVTQSLQQTLARLLLPPAAEGLLRAFLALNLDPEAADAARAADVYGREGVLAWNALADAPRAAGETDRDVEVAMAALAAWGLVEVLGEADSDPVTPGAAALRLSHAGRVCLGLAPARGRDPEAAGDDALPWHILHSASREGLLVSTPTNTPLVLAAARARDLRGLCGEVASAVCTVGRVIVDGFGVPESDRTLLESLITRTARARAVRVLLVPDPASVRVAAARTGARLQWIEPMVQTRRGEQVLDRRITAALGPIGAADASGVPDSDLALLQRPTTDWTAVLLAADVRWQLDLARLHAGYRARLRPRIGYRLLLSGPPGTGKSMAAEALATALDRPLVKLDLSSVLSKWVGETEKFLSHVFDVAETADAVLVLDEAESLLRQREGASGTAGLQTTVAYLLTRLERFEGVLVATTNRTRDLDEAFFRRFDDFIVLTAPDVPTRRRLWCQQLGAEEGLINLDLLAERFALTGGLIRGAVLRALAWASGLGRPLDTALVLASLGRELEKSDRASKDVLVEPYAAEVRRLLRGDDP